ncbi:phospholipase D-like domain-containing protein [Candidatus Deianiraea vastatrix]|uniref:Phospholipase D n=1 Tax=Candidatus Deianiraea vastatrix TaxID=2163644 RepID=A0A5B8XCD7_9RICK|nr:phospholipase D-like domain-containing protein [Candidatus Deianiraea vastatrix]QED22998.1 Putative hydrolase/phosphorylase [Candidatus Deianiraea vastatrix]
MKTILTILTILLSTNAHALTNVCFSPSTCCEDNIVELVNNSKETIDIAIYAFTNQKIYDSLLQAKERGVEIRIVADKAQSKGRFSFIPRLQESGFDVRIKKKVKIEHNKFGVFDQKMIITGSYNWTEAATKMNSENCMLDKRKKVVAKYGKRFEELWKMYDGSETEEITQENTTPRQD